MSLTHELFLQKNKNKKDVLDFNLVKKDFRF